jgi:hypothetical protein
VEPSESQENIMMEVSEIPQTEIIPNAATQQPSPPQICGEHIQDEGKPTQEERREDVSKNGNLQDMQGNI